MTEEELRQFKDQLTQRAINFIEGQPWADIPLSEHHETMIALAIDVAVSELWPPERITLCRHGLPLIAADGEVLKPICGCRARQYQDRKT